MVEWSNTEQKLRYNSSKMHTFSQHISWHWCTFCGKYTHIPISLVLISQVDSGSFLDFQKCHCWIISQSHCVRGEFLSPYHVLYVCTHVGLPYMSCHWWDDSTQQWEEQTVNRFSECRSIETITPHEYTLYVYSIQHVSVSNVFACRYLSLEHTRNRIRILCVTLAIQIIAATNLKLHK